MGCRTRANDYYSRLSQRQAQQNMGQQSIVIEGNVAFMNASVQDNRIQIRRRRAERMNSAQKRAVRRQRRLLAVCIAAAVILLLSLCGIMLDVIDKNTILTKQINSLESSVQSLAVQNDAREYEISSSVDLNYVINLATGSLGMVRSNSSQIVTYSSKNSEYLQQVAAIPKK